MTTQRGEHFEKRNAVRSKQEEQKRFAPASVRGKTNYAMLAALMLAALVLVLGVAGVGWAQTEPPQDKKAADQALAGGKGPTEVERENWRMTILRTPRPKKACFMATYPETEWREVECKTPPNRPYPPRHGIRPLTVGNGVDFSAQVTGFITEGEGLFDNVAGVTSETGGGTANAYSLQLNTEPITTTTCNASPVPAACQGWEQFVYSSAGFGGFIQYWLLNFGPGGTACPAGWISFSFTAGGEVFCFINSARSAPAPAEPITNLGQMRVTGTVAGVNGNADDAIAITVGNTVFTALGDNHFPDLGNHWQIAEFNVFGDGNGDQAVFNAGTTLTVRESVASGTALGPLCDAQGFTGETNNLTLIFLAPPVAHTGIPSLVFQESNAPGSTQTTCAGAVSVGDTHITTFDGLYYDFQASGDFVLAQDRREFIVQARQASGAPTWPSAAVNKAIATQMGKTRVEVYIEPTRLVVDGANTSLADGKSILLPGGVQITRQGNVYTTTSETGDMVRTTLNSAWIDVRVGLGFSPRPQVQGLLGNPLGNAQELVTANGVVLRAPVLFRDVYHTYAESWRVQPEESLFSGETKIRFGIPVKPFYASDLTREQAARALKLCKAAGIKNADFLDSCAIDTTVLNDETAAKVFVHLPRPRHVITPGHHRGHDHDCDCDEDRDRDRDKDKDKDHDRDHDGDRD